MQNDLTRVTDSRMTAGPIETIITSGTFSESRLTRIGWAKIKVRQEEVRIHLEDGRMLEYKITGSDCEFNDLQAVMHAQRLYLAYAQNLSTADSPSYGLIMAGDLYVLEDSDKSAAEEPMRRTGGNQFTKEL